MLPVTKWDGKLLADGCEMAVVFLMLYSRKKEKKEEGRREKGRRERN